VYPVTKPSFLELAVVAKLHGLSQFPLPNDDARVGQDGSRNAVIRRCATWFRAQPTLLAATRWGVLRNEAPRQMLTHCATCWREADLADPYWLQLQPRHARYPAPHPRREEGTAPASEGGSPWVPSLLDRRSVPRHAGFGSICPRHKSAFIQQSGR